MDNDTDRNEIAHRSRRSRSRPRHTGEDYYGNNYQISGSAKRRETDKRRSRSSRKNEWSPTQLETDSNDDEKHGGSLHKREMSRSRIDSGYCDSDCNPAGSNSSNSSNNSSNSSNTSSNSSSNDQKSDAPKHNIPLESVKPQKGSGKTKRSRHPQGRGKKNAKAPALPWVPPPLPEHLRPVPQVRKIGCRFPAAGRGLGVPLQNQFQNDGSFLEVFQQRMQALKAVPVQPPVDVSVVSSAAHTELSCLATATTTASEPAVRRWRLCGRWVIKRRVSKPLKTGMVQKPRRRIDPCEPGTNDKDSWSLYMKEVKKYSANKCLNNEACRPLMK